jgi:hypothetical protein
MPQQGWRSRRVAVAVAAGALVVGVSVLFIVLGIRNQEAADAAVLPPIMPTADAPYACPSHNSTFQQQSPHPTTPGPRLSLHSPRFTGFSPTGQTFRRW